MEIQNKQECKNDLDEFVVSDWLLCMDATLSNLNDMECHYTTKHHATYNLQPTMCNLQPIIYLQSLSVGVNVWSSMQSDPMNPRISFIYLFLCFCIPVFLHTPSHQHAFNPCYYASFIWWTKKARIFTKDVHLHIHASSPEKYQSTSYQIIKQTNT